MVGKKCGLCLLGCLVALLVFNAGSWAIVALAAVALVTNSEINAIRLIARSPPVDVPGILVLAKRQRHTRPG